MVQAGRGLDVKLWGTRDRRRVLHQVRGQERPGGRSGGKDKTSAVPGLVGTCRSPGVENLPSATQRDGTAPGQCPAPPTAPSLHSAMAVESFTATAPFVQIGRFFLSAGKFLAPSDEPTAPRGLVLLLGHLPGAGVPTALDVGSACTFPASYFGLGPEGRQTPRRWGTCAERPHLSQVPLKHGLFQRKGTRHPWCLI